MSSLFFKVITQRITNCFRMLVKIYSFIRKLIFIGDLGESTCHVIEAQISGWDRKMETVFIFIRNSDLRTMENKRLTLSRRDKGWKKIAHCSVPTLSFFLDMEESSCGNVVDYNTIYALSAEHVSKSNN